MKDLFSLLTSNKPEIDWDSHKIWSPIRVLDILGDGTLERVGMDGQEVSLYGYKNRRRQWAYNPFNPYQRTYATESESDAICQEITAARSIWDFLGYTGGVGALIVNRLFVPYGPDEFLERKSSIKALTLLKEKYNHMQPSLDGYVRYGNTYASKIKIGRLINILHRELTGEFLPPSSVEEIANKYKATFDVPSNRIALLNGRDLLLGYDTRYHHGGSNMLAKSCMNNKFTLLKLYSSNPDKVYLLAIIGKDGKILSRNLLWRIKRYDTFLLDRVYSANDHLVVLSRKIAEAQGWIYRRKSGALGNLFVDRGDGQLVRRNIRKVKVKMSFNGVKKYPYIDTMAYRRFFGRTLTPVIPRMSLLTVEYRDTIGRRSVEWPWS